MRLHIRQSPGGMFGIYDEGDHLYSQQRTHFEARCFIEGFEAGVRASKLDREASVDRAVKLVEALR